MPSMREQLQKVRGTELPAIEAGRARRLIRSDARLRDGGSTSRCASDWRAATGDPGRLLDDAERAGLEKLSRHAWQ
jgi:hypothetical protein